MYKIYIYIYIYIYKIKKIFKINEVNKCLGQQQSSQDICLPAKQRCYC